MADIQKRAQQTKPSIVIKNLNEVLVCLQRIRNAQYAHILDATMAGSERVREKAVVKAPYLTGNLRRSIHPEAIVTEPTRALVVIGTDVVYAARMEFGFIGTDSLGRTYHQPAHPYLRPALEESANGVIRDVNVALRAILHAGAR